MAMMGVLTKLDNFINKDYKGETDEIVKARKIHSKILGNYKLTKSDVKFIEKISSQNRNSI